jgi:hypothetical protein
LFSVRPIISVVDEQLDTQSIELNGVVFESGTPVTQDGAYTLTVQATDKAGNTTSATVQFNIDRSVNP